MGMNGSRVFASCVTEANRGAAQAQYDLGLMYSTGNGAPQDYIVAHKWFNLAAMQGMAGARDHRADLARDMDLEDVAQAQRLAREWADCR